jgi:phytoene synthase
VRRAACGSTLAATPTILRHAPVLHLCLRPPPAPVSLEAMTPDQYCRHQLASNGSSIHYSLLFLPPPRRRAAVALHALSRELDDALERSTDTGVAHTRLAWWLQELERLFGGAPQHPVSRALEPHVATYHLTLQDFLPALHARHRELEQVRFERFEDYSQHCLAAAGAFGELGSRMAGSDDPGAWARGARLALAVELIRRLRDVGRRARAGRSAVPQDDLKTFGVDADDLARSRYAAGFDALMQRQAGRARQALKDAVRDMPARERALQQPGIILGVLYETLLEELERSRFQVLHQRIALTPLRKLAIAARTRVLGPARGSLLS